MLDPLSAENRRGKAFFLKKEAKNVDLLAGDRRR